MPNRAEVRPSTQRCGTIPTVLELLELRNNEKVLDIGAGSGVLAPHVARTGAQYLGIDISPTFVRLAKRYHGDRGRFIQGDARRLNEHRLVVPESFDAAVFLLSLQDITPLDEILASASSVLKRSERLVIFMVHPCFRVPRQSGWEWDSRRKLSYRRIDRYLSPLSVPMKSHNNGATRSFHRPLEAYIAALSGAGLWLETLREIPDLPLDNKAKRTQKNNPDIPLFLALRAEKGRRR